MASLLETSRLRGCEFELSIMVPCSGDHTVKIICHRTGQCLKVLSGHRRTPWVVRFHPMQPHIVASGSLDYEASPLDQPVPLLSSLHLMM